MALEAPGAVKPPFKTESELYGFRRGSEIATFIDKLRDEWRYKCYQDYGVLRTGKNMWKVTAPEVFHENMREAAGDFAKRIVFVDESTNTKKKERT